MNPDVRFDDIQVVVNRSSLMNLIKSVRNTSLQDFSLNLDMVNDTLFIGKRTKNPTSESSENKVECGHGFEASLCTDDLELKNIDGHYRVINYMLGPLNIAVRIEVDGYLAEDFKVDPRIPDFIMPDYTPVTGPVTPISHQSPRPNVPPCVLGHPA
jgi:hypothetical protein